jgi:hypothetical protein
LEPSRTNNERLSEYIGGWSLNINITKTSNYIVSPDGTQNATRLQFSANGYVANTPQSLATYTISCYAKRNDNGTQNVGFFTNGSGVVNSAWAVTSEWKRFSYTFPALNGSFMGIAGVSGADISVYGFQIEGLATYPSSYIPNHGTTGGVTRAADSCGGGGSAESINSTEGVLYAEISALADDFANYKFISLYDGTFDNFCDIYFGDASNRISARFRSGSGSVINMFFAVSDVTASNKVAISWKANEFKFFVNGVSRGLNTSGSAPTGLNTLDFHQVSNANTFSGNVKQVALFNEALSDSELATLTTL